jgi:hypothetical protein
MSPPRRAAAAPPAAAQRRPGHHARRRRALVETGAGQASGHLAGQCAANLPCLRAVAAAAEAFKISPDPLLIDKIRDVTGLYWAPPEHAAVFAVGEKPQIQALSSSRTRKLPDALSRPGIAGGAVMTRWWRWPRSTGQPSRPWTRGHAAPMTHSASG